MFYWERVMLYSKTNKTRNLTNSLIKEAQHEFSLVCVFFTLCRSLIAVLNTSKLDPSVCVCHL